LVPSSIAKGIERGSVVDTSRFLMIAKKTYSALNPQIEVKIEADLLAQNLGITWIKKAKK
jgi:hypothetical protein